MPNKSIYNIMNEKVVILSKIKEQYNEVPVDHKDRRYRGFVSSFNKPDDYMKVPANVRTMDYGFSLIQKQKFLYEHAVESLSLYKAAYLEHKKLAESDKIPDAVKNASLNCLREYENAMIENGIDKEMIMGAIIYPDFAQKLQLYYAADTADLMEDFAMDNPGLELLTSKTSIKSEFVRGTGGDKIYTANMNKIHSYDDREVYEAFAHSDIPFFKDIRKDAEPPYSFNSNNNYRCFELKDGKFCEKPYPKGFFNKISYFFTKLAHKSEEEREIRSIISNAEAESRDLPEELKDKDLYADLKLLETENTLQNDLTDALEHDTVAEKFLDYLKQPEKEPESELENVQTVNANDEKEFSLESVD